MLSRTGWPLLGIVLLSACLNLYNNTFPLEYHHDEPKKVLFVRTSDQDFHHPILMLQLARAANSLLGFDNDHQIAVLGRVITAACGAIVVLLTYFLLRTILSPQWSLLSALGVAVSPTIVVHSHYLKEDMLFTACALLALLQFIKLARDANASNTIWLGLATGLAAAAHYKAVLLIPLYLVFPLFGRV